MKLFTNERKRAYNEVLFWAERLSSPQANNYPHWQENYKRAKQKLEEIKRTERNGE